MGRRWYEPPPPKTPERLRAERTAGAALYRAGFYDEVADAPYAELQIKAEVEYIADRLILQHDDPLPRERATPVTVAELRERARHRAWLEELARPRPLPEAIPDDDIPF